MMLDEDYEVYEIVPNVTEDKLMEVIKQDPDAFGIHSLKTVLEFFVSVKAAYGDMGLEQMDLVKIGRSADQVRWVIRYEKIPVNTKLNLDKLREHGANIVPYADLEIDLNGHGIVADHMCALHVRGVKDKNFGKHLASLSSMQALFASPLWKPGTIGTFGGSAEIDYNIHIAAIKQHTKDAREIVAQMKVKFGAESGNIADIEKDISQIETYYNTIKNQNNLAGRHFKMLAENGQNAQDLIEQITKNLYGDNVDLAMARTQIVELDKCVRAMRENLPAEQINRIAETAELLQEAQDKLREDLGKIASGSHEYNINAVMKQLDFHHRMIGAHAATMELTPLDAILREVGEENNVISENELLTSEQIKKKVGKIVPVLASAYTAISAHLDAKQKKPLLALGYEVNVGRMLNWYIKHIGEIQDNNTEYVESYGADAYAKWRKQANETLDYQFFSIDQPIAFPQARELMIKALGENSKIQAALSDPAVREYLNREYVKEYAFSHQIPLEPPMLDTLFAIMSVDQSIANPADMAVILPKAAEEIQDIPKEMQPLSFLALANRCFAERAGGMFTYQHEEDAVESIRRQWREKHREDPDIIEIPVGQDGDTVAVEASTVRQYVREHIEECGRAYNKQGSKVNVTLNEKQIEAIIALQQEKSPPSEVAEIVELRKPEQEQEKGNGQSGI